ncbi:MAG: hypothetical protein CFE62_003820 [Candidatus Aquirickettsiella gammari]|jgi:hypothetical protein|uniref:Uncharacterized protein n=1 Tax=Candidatus Aquirickettsiella gammari TaxID=2016198 RepID=A0A370CJM1_9COXI|nr:MAG: hypothetical protein CFE62_003820 [Candidatus Aquirickettsiella gammari]
MPGKLAVFSKKVNHLLLNSVLIGSYYISGFGTILNNIYFTVNFIECVLANIIDDWLNVYLIISFYLIILICKNVMVQEQL